MKKKDGNGVWLYGTLKKTLRIMRLVLFILLLSVCQTIASAGYSQSAKITLKSEALKLVDVLSKIEDQSEYRFIYDKSRIDLDKKVKIDFDGVTVKEVLKELFVNQGVNYQMIDNQIILTGSAPEVAQQQKTVSGKVTDVAGSALPGVTVRLKGTTQGTITGSDGNFSLTNVPADATLVFSFVGMRTQEIPVSGKTNIQVSMDEEAIGLNEVVAVGYGTQKKVNLTGSVASVSSEDIKTTKTMNMIDNLAGKLSGFRVMQRTSEPGEYSSNFDIRGWGTPLIIVDGVQRENFSRIDPNEVESITILKDASAAIYGVKAANGVILVTTKKGKEGESEITYTTNFGWQQITDYPRPMNAAEFAEAYNWAQQNSGQIPTYSQQQIDDYKSGKLTGTDWWNVTVRNSAPQQQHNLSVSGGTDKVKYFGSLGYFYEEGLLRSKDLDYNRYNLRMNVTAQLTKRLEFELGIGGILDKKKAPADDVEDIFRNAWTIKPTYTVYANNNPDYLQYFDGNHPYAISHASIIGYRHTSNKSFQGNFALNYDVPCIDGLKARFMYGYDINQYSFREFSKSYNQYEYDAETDTYIPYVINSPSRMSISTSEETNSTLQASLNYETTINKKHGIKALLLYENLQLANDNLNGSRNFTVDAVDQFYAGNSEQELSSDPGNIYEFNNQGIIGRVNYDYSSKYLFEFSFRYDGSSKFPKGKRWGFFPAVSLGWRLSEEAFLKNKYAFVDNLKIRATWGKMGDDAASSFQFVPGYVYPTTLKLNSWPVQYPLGYMFGGEVTTGLGFKGIVNPNITWYTATPINLGLDASLWKGRLDLQFDVFRRKRTGLLATRLLSVPETVGAALPEENLNSDLSRGFEISIGTTQKINDFTYNVSGQFSYTHTKWLDKEEAKAGNSYLNWRNSNSNRNTNIIWGYELDGQFQSQEEINRSAIEDGQGNRFVKPGDLKYTDVNGDGIIDDWDVVPIAKGNAGMQEQSIPEITYGLKIGMSWKNFDLNALFQGATNFSVRLIEHLAAPFPWGRNGLSHFYDTWHQADFNDPTSEWIPGKYTPARLSGTNPNNLLSPYYIKDATYLRLKNVEIGYTLPGRLVKKAGIQSCRVFANGFNLVTWSKLHYMDPEHPQAYYGYMYPITRNYNLGLSVSF